MSKLQQIYLAPLLLCAAILIVFVIDIVLFGSLTVSGIRPRHLSGLLGIVTSPFLHGGWSHLLSNILPLFVMGCMVSTLNPKRFLLRTLLMITLSGALTWLISSSGIVIGASGLVFAYWSFLIVHGLRARTFLSIVFAVVTVVIYGALVFALFQHMPGVSWAAHISGAVAGVVLAMRS